MEGLDVRGESACAGLRSAFELVANRPIAHHVVDSLCEAGVEQVVVACSARLAREVREGLRQYERQSGPRFRYFVERGPVNLGEALTLAARVVGDEPCIVHLASGLIDESLAPFAQRLGDAPDVVLMVHQSPHVSERLSPATQQMLHLAELDPARAGLGVAGAFLFGPGALRQVHGAEWRAGEEVDLTSLGERVRAAGGTLDVRLVSGWRSFAGEPTDLLELNRMALDRLPGDTRRPLGNDNRIEGRVQVHASAQVRSSVIIGPAVIGPDACIVDAYIGPYTAIGARARVEGAEIERSIIAAGASVMHVGGRMEGSVVGRDARIFRDFSVPRALRLRVGEGTEVAFY